MGGEGGLWGRMALVAAGGAAGSVGRYALALLSLRLTGGRLPWGTFAANVLGCFGLGVVVALAGRAGGLSELGRLFWATGVMGGLTTYSTYNYETIALAREGRWGAALANAAGTTLACLLACLGGLALGRRA
ncbi:MAG TPA: fluoride efflux transporter CrcB [Polyangiaceae bacterium]|nr:fluoride efflux transporter CrcB [Polyangiaceae bacterium]